MTRQKPSLLSQWTTELEALFGSAPTDAVQAIKQDHRALRDYVGILKDTDAAMSERRRACAAMSALLKLHSHSEEQAFYAPIRKKSGRELHIKVAEGNVEHQLANDLMARLARAKDSVTWSAHANVLAEIVEHHQKEEERSLLPLVRKSASLKDHKVMLVKFIALRAASQKRVTKKNAGVLKSQP